MLTIFFFYIELNKMKIKYITLHNNILLGVKCASVGPCLRIEQNENEEKKRERALDKLVCGGKYYRMRYNPN